MSDKELREMSRPELERLFKERKKALIEVRDEIDRRDKDVKRVVNIDFAETYITK